MSDYLLKCDNYTDVCTMIPYATPPATVYEYALGPEWGLWLVFVVVLAVVIATATVRYNAHNERGSTERTRLLNPPKQCPTCGDKVEVKTSR